MSQHEATPESAIQILQPAGWAAPRGYSNGIAARGRSVVIGGRTLKTHSAGFLSPGERIEAAAGPEGARFIVLAGRPIGEPIVQYGPFVMNTRAEIEQRMQAPIGRCTSSRARR